MRAARRADREVAFDVVMDAERMATAEALWKAAVAGMADPSDPRWKDSRQRRMMAMACAVQMLIAYALTEDDDIGPVLQALPYAAGITVGQAQPERARDMLRAVAEAYAQGVEDAMNGMAGGPASPPVVGRA